MAEIKKAVSTVDLAVQAVGLIKSAALIFAMVLIEWARARQKLAENKQAVAETELEVHKEKGKIDEKNSQKSPGDIVDDFLLGAGADKGD